MLLVAHHAHILVATNVSATASDAKLAERRSFLIVAVSVYGSGVDIEYTGVPKVVKIAELI